MTQAARQHFDERSKTYDQADIHHRVVSMLADGAELEHGMRVADIATGTGFMAIEAARRVGLSGHVLGIDISEGMLAEARAKASATGLENIDFRAGDADRLELPPASLDRLTCASALVLLADAPAALRRWHSFLKPGGIIAFDTPARPFGLSTLIAAAAAEHDIALHYDSFADTAEKCRALLEDAGFEIIAIRRQFGDSRPVSTHQAIAFWDTRLDHPAWGALKQAPEATRNAIHAAYVERVSRAAVAGQVPNDTALNLSFGRKP